MERADAADEGRALTSTVVDFDQVRCASSAAAIAASSSASVMVS